MSDNDTDVRPTETPDTDVTDTSTSDTQTPAGKARESETTSTSARPAGRRASDGEPSSGGRSWRLFGIAAAVVAVVMTVVAVVGLWQGNDARNELATVRAQHDDDARAQKVAADYAVGAAQIDYRNFDPWFGNLRKGVAPKLMDQFTSSERALRDLLGQLQWVSSGKLIGSDITGRNGNTYEVQVFVDVTTSNVQSPQGVKTTALYPITVDKNGWQIADISGGIAPLAGK